MKNIYKILFCNLLGVFLLASYVLGSKSGFWFDIDSAVFFYFNNKLEAGRFFTKLVAITNLRLFDIVSFLAMAFLFLYLFLPQGREEKRKMLGMGFTMLVTAVLIKQFSWLMPLDHPSPTLYFENINRLNEIVSFKTKDSSGNSFPGDHGMMLFIFAGFMGRYFKLRYFFMALGIAIVFSLPRIVSGAHWFGDVYAGALGVSLIVLSWMLCTPASDWLIHKLEKLVPKSLV